MDPTIAPPASGPSESVRVPVPTTRGFNHAVLFTYLRRWAAAGNEYVDEAEGGVRYARSVRLPHGPGVVRISWSDGQLWSEITAAEADRPGALAAVAALVDSDADSATMDAQLATDPHLGPLVATGPGLRIPGTTDPTELAFQALVGQQISMAAAAVCAAKLTRRYGEQLPRPAYGVERLFPSAPALAAADPTELPMPRARGRALVGLAAALAEGRLVLDPMRPWPEMRAELIAQPGIGPWTADYIGLRGLGQRDILLDTDLVIRRELATRQVERPQAWTPWRSYATIHLWRAYV